MRQRIILQGQIAGPVNPVEATVLVSGEPTLQSITQLIELLQIYVERRVFPDGAHTPEVEAQVLAQEDPHDTTTADRAGERPR